LFQIMKGTALHSGAVLLLSSCRFATLAAVLCRSAHAMVGVILLLCLLYHNCAPAGAAATERTAGQLPSDPGTEAAVCSCNITGDSHGGILAADMKSQGGKVAITVHEGLLVHFTASFQGVEVIRDSGLQRCVMAFAGSTHAVLVNSTLQGLAATAISEAAGRSSTPVAVLCFFNSSRV
jgi:hypothetical protein